MGIVRGGGLTTTESAVTPDPVGIGAGGRMRTPIAASVALSFAGKAAELVTLLVLATVVPRMLGPTDYGRFSVPLTIVTVGSLALTLGGPTTMARFVPAAPADRRVALARRLGVRLARGRAIQLAVVAVAAALLVAWDSDRFPPLLTGLVVTGLALNVAATLALQVALGLGRTGAWSARYPLQNAVLIGAVLALYAAAGLTGAVVGIVIAGAVAVAFSVAVTTPVVRVPSASAELPPGAIRFGAVQAAGAALAQFTQRGGVLAVALLGGSDAETGHAALAIGIALGITYAVLQSFTVTLPHLARAEEGGAEESRSARSPTGAAEATLRRLARVVLAVLVPLAAAAAVCLTTVVPAVFGADYGDAAGAFVPALAMVVLAPIHALAVQVSALRLRPQAMLTGGVAGAVVFVAVAIAAVPAWGAEGATLAMLAAAAASAAVALARLPGAAGRSVAALSFAGAGIVLAAGVLA